VLQEALLGAQGLAVDPLIERTDEKHTPRKATVTKKRIWIALAAIVAAGGVYFTWMMMPAGALHATPTPVPLAWESATVPDVVELETRPADPYSVKIWVVPVGDRMYVHAGDNYNRWVQHIEQDPAVRLKVEDRLYELQAQRVTSAEEFADFAQAYEARYGRRPRNENIDEVYLFRLAGRQSEGGS
jgi:hypothetical protein